MIPLTILIDKHPAGQPAHPESLVQMIEDDPVVVHPVLFGSIDVSMIRSIALRTTGAVGPGRYLLEITVYIL